MTKILIGICVSNLILFGCNSIQNKGELDDIAFFEAEVLDKDSSIVNTIVNEFDFEMYQDSLREIILENKTHTIIKESFLQEFYIRGVVTPIKDSIIFDLSFDIHGQDCGAPDCYQTDVNFTVKLETIFNFPKSIRFTEHEHGCIDKESYLIGNFDLIENTPNHVIYHSKKEKRTLVLFREREKSGSLAFYFTDTESTTISGNNIYTILSEYNEEDENSICPYLDATLETYEYEGFME